jgi:hypothetical protein
MTKFIAIILFCMTACKLEENKWTCISGDCNNGVGTRLWKDGGYEKGNWKNGKLNGQGYQFFGETSNFKGDTYTGEFKDNAYEGKGTYFDASEGATYVGYWNNGRPNGFGKMTFATDSKFPNQYYEGEWKDGKKDGHGTQFFGTEGKFKNDKYVGEWKNNKMDGLGKYLFSSGSSYDGQWRNNLKHGKGIHIDKDGKSEAVYCEDDNCESGENK